MSIPIGTKVRFNWERRSDGAYYRGVGVVHHHEPNPYGVVHWVKPTELEIYDPEDTRDDENSGGPFAWFLENELEVIE